MPAPRAPFPNLPALLRALLERPGAASGASMRAWSRSWSGGGVVLIVLCLAVYLPGLFTIPPVDRDESRFAQASRTMLESGDFIVPRIQNTPRLNKPPLIYWLQAASAAIFGDKPGPDGMGQWGNGNIWVFRLPSVLCAIGSVLLTWRLGLRLFDPRAAALAGALLAVSPMVIWDAHQARADQLLLFTTTGAMFALFTCWHRQQGPSPTSPERSDGSDTPRARSRNPLTSFGARSNVFALWILIGLGILAKGPITPMIVALTALALSLAQRNVRWLWSLRPISGLLILTILVGPWVYLVGSRVGWNTYTTEILKETLGRSITPAEHHWAPPGYHLILLPVLFWPGSLLTAAAAVRCWRRGLPRLQLRRRPEAFLLCWIIPSWLVFELFATKLPHYTMPLYPAIALLSARAVLAAVPESTRLPRSTMARLGTLIWALIGIAFLGIVPVLLAGTGEGAVGLAFSAFIASALTCAIVIGIVLAASQSAGKCRLLRAHTLALLAATLCAFGTLGWILPGCPIFWTGARIARVVLRGTEHPSPDVALVGYQEDSAVFMFRAHVSRVSPTDLAAWIDAHPAGVVAVDSIGEPAAAALAATKMEKRQSIRGYNYSTGHDVRVQVFWPVRK